MRNFRPLVQLRATDATDAEIVTCDVAEVTTSDQAPREDVASSAADTKPAYTASNPPARTDWEATFSGLDEIERMDALRALLKVMKIDSVLGPAGNQGPRVASPAHP